MEITKLSDKGQITLPISIRKKLQLKAGDIDNDKDISINDVAQVKLSLIDLFEIK